jgi:hypothetical protein
MVVVGALLVIMVISSALVLSACVYSARRSQSSEQADKCMLELSSRWSGTNFGGKYTTTIPHCSFEPEDLEEFQVAHPF